MTSKTLFMGEEQKPSRHSQAQALDLVQSIGLLPLPTTDTRQYLAATEGRSRTVDKVLSLRPRYRRKV